MTSGHPNVLVVNAGSSSLKLRLLDEQDQVTGSLDLGAWSGPAETTRLEAFVTQLPRIDAVGHRVVHGGAEFSEPVTLTPAVRGRIAALTELAPLHQPRALAGIDAVSQVLPDHPAVACFDTAFHSTLPDAAAIYALPHDWNERFGLRRYGFHGLSHAYASRRGAALTGRTLEGSRIVSCHLGAGASLAAVLDGRSVDTTMGFTPLAGLVMATRTGSVDPGVLLWLQRHAGISVDELADVLERRSGLAGLTGGSGDMREVQAAFDRSDHRAELALAVYVHRLRREIAAMTAALGGLDVLVFTGGVGEHSPLIRAAAGEGLGYLGIALEPDANLRALSDADIGAPGAAVRTVVVTAREDLEIARSTRAVLRSGEPAEPGVRGLSWAGIDLVGDERCHGEARASSSSTSATWRLVTPAQSACGRPGSALFDSRAAGDP